ncbi:MAG: DUF5916 domain-containing protein [Saprospiraceae bacterium]
MQQTLLPLRKFLRFANYLLPLAACLLPWALSAQIGPTTDANRKTATALRTPSAPRLDGELSDACWQSAPVMDNFVTNSPTFGNLAAEKTEVRVVYTDEAIYIGAYLYQAATTVRHDLSKRDGSSTADEFHIGLDTYRDRQNAFRFQITAGGVQSDFRMSPQNLDPNWDAVWDSKVKIHADGWVVELRIPFSAIRFPKQAEQLWGFQFARRLQYVNEFSTWSPVDPNGGGSMPQWGDLQGLRDLHPPLRLAFSPYLAASVQRSPVGNEPASYANSRSVSGGLDVKWGLSESFTLDATLVPNFGEAQSDNTVRNLSPFEVQYEERRQFFTEGTELFSKGGIFYSRRIGGTPRGFSGAAFSLDSNEVVRKNPSEVQLYNATKFSGRTRSKLGIGVLNAVAAPSNALVFNESTGQEYKYRTSELTNYNVLALDQSLPHNSAVSLINTNILRAGGARDANVSALVFNLRDKANRYEIFGENRLSLVWPTNATQPEHGFGYLYGLGKVSGAWGWQIAHYATDQHYDQRDMGFFTRNNFFNFFGKISKGNFRQRGKIASSYFELSAEQAYLKAPFQWESLHIEGFGELSNTRRQTYSIGLSSRPLWYYDYFESRVKGAKFYRAPYVFVSPGFRTNSAKHLFAFFRLSYGESPLPNDPYLGFRVNTTWVLSTHCRLIGTLDVSKDHSNYGVVDYSNPADIVFGRRNITSFDNELAAEYLFTPRMSASVRGRHYWSQLYYHQYLHLNEDGTFSPSDWPGRADGNYDQFNLDFVYSWQFAPGSYLNLIWKDAIARGDEDRGDGFRRNWNKTFHSPQDNTLTLKIIYWLDAGGWGRH